MEQLSLDSHPLIGQSWWSEEHGRCEVVAPGPWKGWYAIQVRALGGHRRFRMVWPELLVRREPANPSDIWLGDNHAGFFNASEHLRLAEAGLIPLDPEIAAAVAAGDNPSPSAATGTAIPQSVPKPRRKNVESKLSNFTAKVLEAVRAANGDKIADLEAIEAEVANRHAVVVHAQVQKALDVLESAKLVSKTAKGFKVLEQAA